MSAGGLADGTRITITGNPTAEEVAAVVLALDMAYAQHGDQATRRPGWREAARREAVGGRLVRSRADLDNPLP